MKIIKLTNAEALWLVAHLKLKRGTLKVNLIFSDKILKKLEEAEKNE